MSSHDVVVVGGRVAGASTALLLARAGLKVALVDRGRRGSDTLSTHALMRAGVLQLSRWGVLDTIVAAGTPAIRHTLFHYPDGAHVDVAIKPRAGVEALYAPRRHLLDRVLVDAAEEAGVQVWHETTVTALRRDAVGRVRGVSARRADGARVDLSAALTVGADGIRSVVADQVGSRIIWQGRAASAVLYRYVEDGPADGYEWAYGSGAAAGVIPTNDGAVLCLRGHHSRPNAAPAAVGRGAGHGRAARGGRPRCSGPRARCATGLPGPGLVRRRRTCPPLMGSGMGAGRRRWLLQGPDHRPRHHRRTAGRRAARRTGARRARRPGGTGGGAGSLPRLRERLSRQLFEVTEGVAAYDWDADGIRNLLRRLSAAMGDEVDHLDALSPTASTT